MFAVKAIYDESKFVLDEPIPVKGKYEVLITFTNPVKKDQGKLLEYAGMFDTDDVQYHYVTRDVIFSFLKEYITRR